MKKKNIPVEFVFQLFALIIAIIVVHAFYVSVVRPNAAEIIIEQSIAADANPGYIKERSTWVLIKDMEQEACFVLMFWALAIMGFKTVTLLQERNLLEVVIACLGNLVGIVRRHAGITELRSSYRDFGINERVDVGFRIARNVK